MPFLRSSFPFPLPSSPGFSGPGSGLSKRFIEAGFSYLDARGNCHIDLGAFYVHIEGRTSPTQVAHTMDRGIRRAGYQVLFAYLAKPEAWTSTAGQLSGLNMAGVSADVAVKLREL